MSQPGQLERWAPLALSSLALLLVLLLTPNYAARLAARDLAHSEELRQRDAEHAAAIATLREKCARLETEAVEIRQAVATLQASVWRLTNEMTKAGVRTQTQAQQP